MIYSFDSVLWDVWISSIFSCITASILRSVKLKSKYWVAGSLSCLCLLYNFVKISTFNWSSINEIISFGISVLGNFLVTLAIFYESRSLKKQSEMSLYEGLLVEDNMGRIIPIENNAAITSITTKPRSSDSMLRVLALGIELTYCLIYESMYSFLNS